LARLAKRKILVLTHVRSWWSRITPSTRVTG
jgi:hypothetical protein